MITTLSILLFSLSLSAQPTYKTVEQAVEALRKAMVQPQEQTLSALVADQLSYGHSNGVVENKARFIGSLVSGKYKFLEIVLSDQSVSSEKGLAIVRHRLWARTHDQDKPEAEIKLGILLVWRWEKRTWKLIARQACKL